MSCMNAGIDYQKLQFAHQINSSLSDEFFTAYENYVFHSSIVGHADAIPPPFSLDASPDFRGRMGFYSAAN